MSKLLTSTDKTPAAAQGSSVPGWLRIPVFCLSLLMMLLIIAWPHLFGRTTATMEHNAALISMLGMSCGFVYGIGFVARQRWLNWLFSAPMATGLMVLGVLLSWL